MSNVLERLPEGSRVAVIRLRSMGDCVLTTPALDILKQARRDILIGVVVEDRFAPLFQGNPDVETILPPRIRALRRFRAVLCLNLHGGLTSARLTALSGAGIRAGFAHFRFPMVYNERIPRAQEILRVNRKVHTAEHLASAVFHLGAPRAVIPQGKLVAPKAPYARPYAVIHPLASEPSKTWPVERFLKAAEFFKRSIELEPVFIGGYGEDLSPFRAYRTVSGAPLPEVMSLIRGAGMFLGNDSGPAHLAAAFNCPVAVIFGSSDPAVWAPWNTFSSEVLTSPTGITGVTEKQVFDALERLRLRVRP